LIIWALRPGYRTVVRDYTSGRGELSNREGRLVWCKVLRGTAREYLEHDGRPGIRRDGVPNLPQRLPGKVRGERSLGGTFGMLPVSLADGTEVKGQAIHIWNQPGQTCLHLFICICGIDLYGEGATFVHANRELHRAFAKHLGDAEAGAAG
jgi:hypothetical protein